MLGGLGANDVLPLRIGDLLRARWLATSARIPTGRAFGSVFRDRACDVLTLVAALILSLPFIGSAAWVARIAIGGVVLLGILVLVVLAAITYAQKRPRARREQRSRGRKLLRDTIDELASPIGRRTILTALGLSVVAWSVWATAAGIVCRSLGIHLSPVELVFVTAVINLGVVIPSSPGFIGTYQWLAVSALSVVGVHGEVAIAFSLLMQAVWYIPTTIVGGVIAIREVHRDATRSRTGRAASTIARVKVLLVSFYFPPAGGGGVQRPLKLAQYLPALGIETHVLAPDDPHWIHRDEALRVPTQAWVHRARYLGPVGRKPAEELHGKEGLARLAPRRGCSAAARSSRTRTCHGTSPPSPPRSGSSASTRSTS